MHVLDGVTAVAVLADALVDLTKMAGCAGHRLVRSIQCKLSSRVIEDNGIAPARFAMARFARRTEIALVWFIFLVAARTGKWRLCKSLLLGMATATGHVLVCTREFEIGRAVIEQRLVQLHHIKVAALVIVMALVARHAFSQGTKSVKAALGVNVGFHRLVAREAQAVLGIL